MQQIINEAPEQPVPAVITTQAGVLTQAWEGLKALMVVLSGSLLIGTLAYLVVTA